MLALPRHCSVFLIPAGFVIGLCFTPSAGAQTLRYNWKEGQKFSYQFDIKVEEDDATTTFKGITNYTVDKAAADQFQVTYRGGLSESKALQQSRAGRGFPLGGPPRMSSPFSRPTFAGKTQTTNKITLTPRGNVLTMEGDSQLPYLLGNVSLLPFEALPAADEKEWKVDSGVSITEENENRRHRFGPFDPFANNDPKNVQAASEVTSYDVQSTSDGFVKIARKYKLVTPEVGDNPAFDFSGTGVWTFDSKENIPHSLDMDCKLTVKQGNTTTAIPIVVKFTRISAEELAKMEAANKQRLEEAARLAAAAKAAAEAPLTAEEKQAALDALTASDAPQIEKKLAELAAKTPLEPDADVTSAIEKLITHPEKKVADAAHKALLNWSPKYKLTKSLQKDYQGPGVLKSTELVVESTTPLFVGQIVQAQRNNRGPFWFAAKVEELQSDGKVRLGFLTWGEIKDHEVVERRKIQRAPEELPQPDQPATVAADVPAAGLRMWSDASGLFKIEATFVEVKDGVVSLRTADDRVLAVPLAKLSAADQAFVKQLESIENPFESKP